MHILLTDLLTCPRCGPEFGLIVMADRIDDRRVGSGVLGCSNCRERYPIEAGVVDLRHASVAAVSATDAFGADEERVYRAAALLGMTRPNANILAVDADGSGAIGISRTLPMVHVIGLVTGAIAEDDRGTPPDAVEDEGVLSRVRGGQRVPLRSQAVHGFAMLGTSSPALLAEAARVLVRGARVVVDPAGPDTGESLRELGFELQLEQEGVVVAAAPGAR